MTGSRGTPGTAWILQDAGTGTLGMVDATKFTHFERALLDSENESASCVLLLLAWIAASGGTVVEADVARLSELAASSDCDIDVEYLFGLAHRRDLEALQLACEVVQRSYYGDRADDLLNLAIPCAIADGKLHPGRNYLLRFIAELVGVKQNALNRLFAGITGKPIPAPDAIDTAEYWDDVDRGDTGRQYSRRQEYQGEYAGEDPFLYAYDELGLPETATIAEIRAAYRQLAQKYHPDRVASLGDEAVAEATARFQRIQESYQHLMKHA